MRADDSVRLGLEAAPKRLERRRIVKKCAEVPDFGMTRMERAFIVKTTCSGSQSNRPASSVRQA